MPIIKINGVSYDAESLTDEIRSHLQRLAFIDAEVDKIRLQMDILRVARDEIGSRLDKAIVAMDLNVKSSSV